MPPISCTSKWRMRRARLEASRTTAKASGRSSSSVAPSAWRFFSSSVLPRSAGSESLAIAGSSALIAATLRRYCFSRRSFRLPKILVRTLVIIKRAWRRNPARNPQKPLILSGNPDCHSAKAGLLLGSRLRRRRVRHQELAGVLRRAAIAHLEMQVRAGRAPGGAHFADLVAPLHDIALLHVQLRLVGVARDEVVAMVDVDHVAVL